MLADIFHGDRLAAAGVVRHRDHAQRDVLRADAGDELFQGGGVEVAFEVGDAVGIGALGHGQIDGRGADELDVRPRGVEMGIVRHLLAGSADDGEEDAFGGASLVGGDDVFQAGQLADFALEAEEAAAAGVGFLAAHDARPLVRAHGGRAAVGQQVDEHLVGRDEEEVIVAAAEGFLALLDGGEADRLDRLDLEGLDDGLHGPHLSTFTVRGQSTGAVVGGRSPHYNFRREVSCRRASKN